YIVTNAVLFSFLMTSEQIPQVMTSWIVERGVGWIEFLLFVNLLLLLAGIVMTVNMEVGLCHPPVGLNLYVASGIAKMGITELTVAVWPWLLTMLVFLVIVTYVPELSLWLPRMLGML